jgi:hypothetical protein
LQARAIHAFPVTVELTSELRLVRAGIMVVACRAQCPYAIGIMWRAILQSGIYILLQMST